MSDKIVLAVQPRETLGKGVKKLRADGFIPAVIADHGKESTHIQVEYQSFVRVLREAGRHHPIEITGLEKPYVVLVRNLTRDPKLNTVTHVMLNAVAANQMVEAGVPVKPKFAEDHDNHPAERTGLIVLSQIDEVQVKAFPKNLPDELFYDAEKLAVVGDHVTVADLIVPEGVTVETEASHAVATVFEPSALAAANEAAAGDAEEAAPATDEATEEAAPATEEAKE
jgi:large subunit ribosomal protein L25